MGMGYDGPNFEGANIRQVLTQGDQASQLQAARRDTADFQSRMGATFVEKGLRAKDQATSASDMVVHRQEDQAEFSAGVALNGGSNGTSGGQEDDASDPNKPKAQVGDSEPALEILPDPFELAEHFGQELHRLGKSASTISFRSMDRRLLAGLSGTDLTGKRASDTYKQQSILTGGTVDSVRMCLEAALREGLHLMGGNGELDRLRKLLSLIRQGCRPEPGPGRDLASLAGHMLVRISRDEAGALGEALGLLSHIVGSIRDWRTEVTRGMLPPWAMR